MGRMKLKYNLKNILLEEAPIDSFGYGKNPHLPPDVADYSEPGEPEERGWDDEELEEQSRTDRPDRVAGRDTSGRRLDEEDDEKDDDDDTKDDVPAFLKKEELQERIATLLTKYIKG